MLVPLATLCNCAGEVTDRCDDTWVTSWRILDLYICSVTTHEHTVPEIVA